MPRCCCWAGDPGPLVDSTVSSPLTGLGSAFPDPPGRGLSPLHLPVPSGSPSSLPPCHRQVRGLGTGLSPRHPLNPWGGQWHHHEQAVSLCVTVLSPWVAKGVPVAGQCPHGGAVVTPWVATVVVTLLPQHCVPGPTFPPWEVVAVPACHHGLARRCPHGDRASGDISPCPPLRALQLSGAGGPPHVKLTVEWDMSTKER